MENLLGGNQMNNRNHDKSIYKRIELLENFVESVPPVLTNHLDLITITAKRIGPLEKFEQKIKRQLIWLWVSLAGINISLAYLFFSR